jgi:hypothetical protein
MAIPIRLLLANGKDQIDLVAQSIDMSVDRKASAFPTPDNMLKRFAIDTNTPQIQIEVNGIFVDDEGVSANSDGIFEAEPMRSAINFGAFFPTNSSSPLSSLQHFCGTNGVDAISSNGLHLDSEFKVVNKLSKNQSNIVTVQTLPGSNMEFASDSTAQIDANPYQNFNSASVFSTSVNQITVNYSGSGTFTAENEFNIGDRLVKSSGLTIGDIQSISGNVITFTGNIANALSAGEQIHLSLQVFDSAGFKIGNIEYITDDSSISNGTKAIYNIKLHETNTVPLLENASIFIDRRESMVERFKNQTIKLIPSLWLSRPDRVYGQNSVTHDTSMDSNLTTVGSSTMSSSVPRIGVRIQFDVGTPYTSAHTFSTDAAQMDAVINLPIKDIHTVDNPALEMANRVKAAFELSGNVVRSGSLIPGFNLLSLTFDTGKTLSDAFRIVQNGTILTFEQVYSPPEPILHPSIISADLNSLFGETQFHSQSNTPVESRKSAGDKAQDLIGLVSNSDRTVDLLRGIQIPYDSLIQSSGVTGVARNFFLTFGEVPILDKGSASNNRPASQKMDNLLLNMTGLQTDDSPDSWFERNLKAITPNEIESLFGFLVGIGKDAIWLTLQTNLSSVNEGGIRIIPEKLHVRYDAGNNYYAYSLLLSASDFVIGV